MNLAILETISKSKLLKQARLHENKYRQNNNTFIFNFWRGFFIFFRTVFNTASSAAVPTDAGIEPRTVASSALTVRRSKH
jgi:hypothetical protein